MYDDPDGDWGLYQRLTPSLPAADLRIPHTSAALVESMGDSPEEAAARAIDVPPLVESETVWSLAWSPCGRFLASGGDQGGIRLWVRMGSNPDSELHEVVHTSAHRGACYAMSWGPGGAEDGVGLLATAGADGRVIVWQVKAVEGKGEVPGAVMEPLAAMRDAHGVADVNSIAWNVREDGKGAGLLASAGDDGSVKVWRVVADEV